MKHVVMALSITVLVAALLGAAEVKLEGVKCIVAGEQVSASVSADYKDGKVFFCCANCVQNFKSDTAKYAAKANHQLAATGQAKQVNCPLSGEPISQDRFLEVGGAKVYFCCDSCKNRAAEASGDQQMEMVFGEAAWKKGGFQLSK